jgi:hypothetical protein
VARRWTAGRVASAVAVGIAVLAVGAAQAQRADWVLVTFTVSGPGAIAFASNASCRSGTCTLTVDPGQALTLTAAPDVGNHLDAWGGACVGTATTCKVVANASLAVTAAFAPGVARLPPLVRLNVTRSPGGTVSSDPPGSIDCGTTCKTSLSLGTGLTLNAVADPGSTFVGWFGACTGTGACSVTLTGPQDVTALFRDVTIPGGSSVLTLVNDDAAVPQLPHFGGTVTVTTPAGTAACTVATCAYTVANGSTVRFDGLGGLPTWSSGCVGTASRCQLVVSRALTITISFPMQILASSSFGVNVSRTNGGTITSVPPGVKCGESRGCAAAFPEDTNVALRAVADPGYGFLGWGGDCVGTGKCSVVTDGTRSVVASFGSLHVSISVARTGAGKGTVSSGDGAIDCGSTCGAAFDRGSPVTFQAVALPGSAFVGWSGVCAGAGVGACTFTPSGDATVAARFDRCALSVTPPLTATASRSPRRAIVWITLAGDAQVTVRLLRNGRAAAPAATRKTAAGRTVFSFALPAKAPRVAYQVQVTVKDACGGQLVLRRQVTA